MSRSRESAPARRDRARRVIADLRRIYPEARCALRHESALELLVATILSAQCTDARVNQITPRLFARYRTAADWASAPLARLEIEIRPTGFFRNKARALAGLGRALIERHGGVVPRTMDELTALPGVGRKTANVVLGTWFGEPAIAVDTHVTRLAGRLAFSDATSPEGIEADLARLVPPADWTFLSLALIEHGRRVCFARRPACTSCPLRPDCPRPDAGAAAEHASRR